MKIDVPCSPGDLIAFRYKKQIYTVPVQSLHIGQYEKTRGLVCLSGISDDIELISGEKFCDDKCKNCPHGGCHDLVYRAIAELLPDEIFYDYAYGSITKGSDTEIPFEFIGPNKPFRLYKRKNAYQVNHIK